MLDPGLYSKELLIKERICSLWEKILSFKRSSYLKRGAIEENRFLIKNYPFDVPNFFSVLATLLRICDCGIFWVILAYYPVMMY